jgi:hypothetical protein
MSPRRHAQHWGGLYLVVAEAAVWWTMIRRVLTRHRIDSFPESPAVVSEDAGIHSHVLAGHRTGQAEGPARQR